MTARTSIYLMSDPPVSGIDIEVVWNQIRSCHDTVSRFGNAITASRSSCTFCVAVLREIRIECRACRLGIRIKCTAVSRYSTTWFAKRSSDPWAALIYIRSHGWPSSFLNWVDGWSKRSRTPPSPSTLARSRGVRLRSSIHEYAWREVGAREKIYGPDSLTFRGPRLRSRERARAERGLTIAEDNRNWHASRDPATHLENQRLRGTLVPIILCSL